MSGRENESFSWADERNRTLMISPGWLLIKFPTSIKYCHNKTNIKYDENDENDEKLYKNKDCDKWISDRKYFVLHLNSILKVKDMRKVNVFCIIFLKQIIDKEINKPFDI